MTRHQTLGAESVDQLMKTTFLNLISRKENDGNIETNIRLVKRSVSIAREAKLRARLQDGDSATELGQPSQANLGAVNYKPQYYKVNLRIIELKSFVTRKTKHL